MLRAMRFEDLDSVVEIENRVFPNPWPRCFFEKDLESKNAIAYVVEENGKIIGYSLGMCIDVELHISNIAVDKDFQRRGLGSDMLREMEKVAVERGCGYAYLEVRTTNVAAIAMYKRKGYDILYLRRRYYLDGNDAYVMHKELK